MQRDRAQRGAKCTTYEDSQKSNDKLSVHIRSPAKTVVLYRVTDPKWGGVPYYGGGGGIRVLT